MVTSTKFAICVLMMHICANSMKLPAEYDEETDAEIVQLDQIRHAMNSKIQQSRELKDALKGEKKKFYPKKTQVHNNLDADFHEDTEIDNLKKHWLGLLGLQSEPSVTVKPSSVPKFMRAVFALYDSDFASDGFYENTRPEGIAEEDSRTIRALLPQKDMGVQSLNWTFNHIRPDEVLGRYSRAELVLNIGRNLDTNGCDEYKGSYLTVSTSVSDWSDIKGVKRKIEGIPECWAAFDLSQAFNSWKAETENLQSVSMYVSVRVPNNESNIYDLYRFDVMHEPLLVLYTHDPSEMKLIQTLGNTVVQVPEFINDNVYGDDSEINRVKRSMANERYGAAGLQAASSEDEDTACTLKRWYVTFAELGWGDWIVTPRGINANYCEGSCAIVGNMTNHAFIKKVFRERYDRYDLPHAYCVPTKIQPMSVLFSTNGTIFLKRMPEMKAEACGCL